MSDILLCADFSNRPTAAQERDAVHYCLFQLIVYL